MPELSSFSLQGEEIQNMLNQLSAGKLVHAYLITGEKGVGKRTFAMLIASALICRSEKTRPCGECRDCRQVLLLEHPDLTVIQKGVPISSDVKKERSTIPVEDIREMIRICSAHTFDGRPRVILLFDAEKMTVQAQNCLLKTLEEPPENTYLILVTEHPDMLLNTVISRTRPVHLHSWPDSYIRQILAGNMNDPERIEACVEEAYGSIGKALALASDEEYWQIRNEIIRDFFGTLKRSEILRISNAWKDRRNEADRLLEILESVIRGMLEDRFRQTKRESSRMLSAAWQNFARGAEIGRFTALLDSVSNVRRQLQFNVNFQAVIEQLLFTLMGEGNLWSVS